MTALLDFDEGLRPRTVFETVKELAQDGDGSGPFNANTVRRKLHAADGHVIAAAFQALAKEGKIERYENSLIPPERSNGKNSRGRTIPWWVGKGAGFV